MRVNTFSTAAATLAALVFSSPAAATEPCAELGKVLANQNKLGTSPDNYPIIPEIETVYVSKFHSSVYRRN